MSCRVLEEMLEKKLEPMSCDDSFAFCQVLGEAWGMVANHLHPHTAEG
jgi:hypothetical protein